MANPCEEQTAGKECHIPKRLPHLPHCGVLSVHNKVQVVMGVAESQGMPSGHGGTRIFTAQRQHHIVRCINCRNDTYLLYRTDFMNGDNPSKEYPPATVLHQHPISTPSRHASVPEAAAK